MNDEIAQQIKTFRERIHSDPLFAGLNLDQLARLSIRLRTSHITEAELAPGSSRIGGIPDVLPGFEWPRWLPTKSRDDKYGQPYLPSRPAPFGFIAQLDLSTLPRISDELPKTGWLLFFYDRYCEPWGFDPADRGCCLVIYFDGVHASLTRAIIPDDFEQDHLAECCQVTATIELTLPDDCEQIIYGTPAYEAYQGLLESMLGSSGSTHHRLLGHPQLVQNPFELECQLVTNGIYCGDTAGYQTSEAKALEATADDWQLLLQIDTDEDGPGWMWGDVGRIYFCIRKQDLVARNFDKVWLIFQCY